MIFIKSGRGEKVGSLLERNKLKGGPFMEHRGTDLELIGYGMASILIHTSSDREPATRSQKLAQHLVRSGYICMKQKMKDHTKIILFEQIT